MRLRAVVDQIEAGKAFLIVTKVNERERKKIIWPEEFLPEGTKERDIIYIDAQIDQQETEEILKENKERMDRLINRNQNDSRDKDS